MAELIAEAAEDPANDAAANPAAVFAVMQNAGAPVVAVESPPVVKFTVISDGAVVEGLTTSNVRIALAKLARGIDGDPDDWVNYYNSPEIPTAGVGPGGAPALPEGAPQASTDPRSAEQLVYNEDGYYEYTFATDVVTVTDPLDETKTLWDPNATHRVGMQLNYQNAAGETIENNPTFDFTFSADGEAFTSVEVTDPAQTRKVVDVTSCNQCHGRLAMHGDHRFDPQFCVLCHNERTTDANSGNNLRMKTMVHKVHAGRRLAAAGQDYVIWGYRDSEHAYADAETGEGVGFPQDLRNCTKCHDGNKAAQADNWKSVPTKQACLSCHTTDAESDWYSIHVTSLGLYLSGDYDDISNKACGNCHGAGEPWSPDRAHFNQAEVNAAKYKMNIESVAYDAATRDVTITYYMSDPTNADAKWDLCDAPVYNSRNRLYVGYQNLPNQPTAVTEFSSYNNGGSGARIAWCDPGDLTNPQNDGTNTYTAVVQIPADVPGVSVLAGGTARVITSGRVTEPATDVDGNPKGGEVRVSVQNTFRDFAISGSLTPRRQVVSNDKCNDCHSTLGTAVGSNTHLNAFHGGSRNIVESCVICHDPNRASTTVMADGSAFNESYHFKRLIHGLHASPTSVRTYPYTHDNVRQDAYDKDCSSTTNDGRCTDEDSVPYPEGNITNFATEVHWPGIISDCNTCHVNDSWAQDRGVLGSTLISSSTSLNNSATPFSPYSNPLIDQLVASGACLEQTGTVAGGDLDCAGGVDVTQLPVVSPKAGTCTACHDSLTVRNHVKFAGGGAFGTDAFDTLVNQEVVMAGGVAEICTGCHAPGSGVGAADISLVHDVK